MKKSKKMSDDILIVMEKWGLQNSSVPYCVAREC